MGKLHVSNSIIFVLILCIFTQGLPGDVTSGIRAKVAALSPFWVM